MSSRSFRRRNNRRRHRSGAEGGDRQPQGHPQPSSAEVDRRDPRAPDAKARPREEGASTGGQRKAGADTEPHPREASRVVPNCPVCDRPLRELPSALTHRATGKPAHFDCIVREIREANDLSSQEKICYLGGGCFGILEFRQPGGAGRFVIRKRIPYEEKETPQDWRKGLLFPC